MTALALIPARGGSKGLPRKNVAPLGGKPLIVHSIEAARAAARVDRVAVSTEDQEIAAVALAAGAEVIERPPALATDAARSADVALHALEAAGSGGADLLVLLQPTSPLRSAAEIDACLARFDAARAEGRAASTLSVAAVEHHPYKCFRLKADGALDPLFGVEASETPRQLLPEVVRPNGAIYALPADVFRQERRFFVPPVLPYLMDAAASVDIDTAWDLAFAELTLARGAGHRGPR